MDTDLPPAPAPEPRVPYSPAKSRALGDHGTEMGTEVHRSPLAQRGGQGHGRLVAMAQGDTLSLGLLC